MLARVWDVCKSCLPGACQLGEEKFIDAWLRGVNRVSIPTIGARQMLEHWPEDVRARAFPHHLLYGALLLPSPSPGPNNFAEHPRELVQKKRHSGFHGARCVPSKTLRSPLLYVTTILYTSQGRLGDPGIEL